MWPVSSRVVASSPQVCSQPVLGPVPNPSETDGTWSREIAISYLEGVSGAPPLA